MADLRLFVAVGFEGHWPVGTSAIALAEDETDARRALDIAIRNKGLPGLLPKDPVEEVSVHHDTVMVLTDGNY